MSGKDINNPDVIKFLVESYEKTTRLRQKWQEIYGVTLREAATLQREAKGYYETDVLKAAMAIGMTAITRDHISAEPNRKRKAIRDGVFIPGVTHLRKGHSIPEVGLGTVTEDPRLARPDTDLTKDPVMRPPDPKQKKTLPKPENGRTLYLKARGKILPENRYYFRQTGSWEYGWRLKDSMFSKHAPTYGRVWRYTRDERSRTGPQPDPQDYKKMLTGVAKCTI